MSQGHAYPSAHATGNVSNAPDAPRLADSFRVRLSHRLADFLTRHRFAGSFRLRDRLTRWLMPSAAGPVILRTNPGFDILVDPLRDQFQESNIYYFGAYEPETLHMLGLCLRAGDVFVDVGANIGQMSLLAGRLIGPTGTVLALEPMPETFAILQRNIVLNGLSNIHAVNSALGSRCGSAFMTTVPGNRGASAITTEPTGPSVTVTTLDDSLAAAGVTTVTMAKIDVEGYELEVLRGAMKLLTSQSPPILCVESPRGRGEGGQLLHLLWGLKCYRAYKLSRHWSRKRPLIEVADERQLPSAGNIYCFTADHQARFPWLA